MRTRGIRTHRDEGSALIITLMVMVLVMALSTTVAVLTIDNLRGSLRAQQAGSAVNAADAGVAQAMSYLRANGVRTLNACPPTCTDPWANPDAPKHVVLSNDGNAGEEYKVWIQTVRPYPANNPGRYLIHSTGLAAAGASRSVTVEVSVTAAKYPRGIFARTVSGGGNASVTRESVFSTGCVARRGQIEMDPDEMDLAYGIPVGVHTSDYITEHNVSATHCTPSEHRLIHRASDCNSDYPNDQDRLGGDLLAHADCRSVQSGYPQYYGSQDLDGDGGLDVVGSYLEDDAALMELFDFVDPVFTPEQLDQLRAVARAQKNYTETVTPPDWSPDQEHAVMFFDLRGSAVGGTVDLNNITGFTPATTCTKSLVVVIEGGNAKLNSNQQLAASIFLTSPAPNGQIVKANGTSDFLGTIYADRINLVGTTNLRLDECFVANPSPSLLTFQVGEYRELDRALD